MHLMLPPAIHAGLTAHWITGSVAPPEDHRAEGELLPTACWASPEGIGPHVASAGKTQILICVHLSVSWFYYHHQAEPRLNHSKVETVCLLSTSCVLGPILYAWIMENLQKEKQKNKRTNEKPALWC